MSAATPDLQHRYIEPLDVLFLRGNKLFGDPGSHGESLVPPWPSAAAGALRSQVLAHDGVDLRAFAQGQIDHPSLGTPTAPGSFVLTAFTLAQRFDNGTLQTLHAMPADLVVTEKEKPSDQVFTTKKALQIQSLRPQSPSHGMQSSGTLAQAPVLPEAVRRKAETGLWLTQAGWQSYLSGQLPNPATDLVNTSELWAIDSRVGIGMDAVTRSAEEGKLFTAQAVAFKPGIGFVASVRGAALPEQGTLRLGGDGRAASSQSLAHQTPQADLHAIAAQGRCRVVLTTPGLFTKGWLPNGFAQQSDGHHWLELHGVRARLVCATVPRAETISGWDLASWQPKAALRAAPTGSVYWLDQLQASPEALGKLAESGFWSDACEDTQRRAEGFNRFAFAAHDCA
ncbi:type III-B CRISPR module-associated protein Cmr3 [Limnohabitans sp. Rim8]|uniref:type III-B CRISPR module-associated protein Cmr3 n=1 Tax=Limnohabitans sp. Rim8 TaxID=1100718 RepID=UPI002621B6F9|nr:type III-B CRISPR module-associated protein Cmr3 [Limnohabitans sp. Rim8]